MQLADHVAGVVGAAGTSDDRRGYGQAVGANAPPGCASVCDRHAGVYGFATRNVRTLADHAPEAMLSLVTKMAIPSGLRPVGRPGEEMRDRRFPYVVPARVAAAAR